jgi:hypothetical protein
MTEACEAQQKFWRRVWYENPAGVLSKFHGGMLEDTSWTSASRFWRIRRASIYQRSSAGAAYRTKPLALTHCHVQGSSAAELGDYVVDVFVDVLLTAGFRGGTLCRQRDIFASR